MTLYIISDAQILETVPYEKPLCFFYNKEEALEVYKDIHTTRLREARLYELKVNDISEEIYEPGPQTSLMA